MYAELKWIHSPDIDDFSSYYPENPDSFAFLLQAMIGIKGEDGEDTFDIEVCTPEWLKSNYSKDEVLIVRHMMIVFEYDFERIKQRIKKYCDGTSGKTWEEIAEKLSRIGHWEFEDYECA